MLRSLVSQPLTTKGTGTDGLTDHTTSAIEIQSTEQSGFASDHFTCRVASQKIADSEAYLWKLICGDLDWQPISLQTGYLIRTKRNNKCMCYV